MKLFFKSYFILSFVIVSLQIHASGAGTHVSAKESEAPYIGTLVSPKESAARRAVWMLNKNNVSGTGFFIGPNKLVTNVHVIDGLLQKGKLLTDIIFKQEDRDGRMVTSEMKVIEIEAISVTHDLVVLKIDKKTDDYLTINPNQRIPENTKNLFSPGYPGRKFFQTQQISPLQKIGERLVFSTNLFKGHGSSGSPVLDSNDRVIGVLSTANNNVRTSISQKHLMGLIKGEIGVYCGEKYKPQKCIEKAIELTRKEAEGGYPVAQHALYQMMNSKGFTEEAVKWLKEAADQDYVFAQDELGRLYYYVVNNGVEQNLHKAVKLLKKAEENKFAPSLYMLGMMHYNGHAGEGQNVLPTDLRLIYFNVNAKEGKKEAETLLKQAAENGYAPAQYSLGDLYLKSEL